MSAASIASGTLSEYHVDLSGSILLSYLSQPRQLPINVSFKVTSEEFKVSTLANKVAQKMGDQALDQGKQKLIEIGNNFKARFIDK
jgi:hypothetical protein